MIFLVLVLKPIAWYVAFRSGTGGDLKTVALWAAGITLFLTLADKVSVASNLPASAILLTLVLYGLMCFTLIPLAWKVKQRTFRVVLNLVGMIGAFAGVNFIMDFLRGFLPLLTR